MDAKHLKAVQAPLKQKYRDAAVISIDVPAGFKAMRLRFDFAGDASREQLDSLLKLTERYCKVYQTLTHSPRFTVSYRRREGRDTLFPGLAPDNGEHPPTLFFRKMQRVHKIFIQSSRERHTAGR